MAKWWDDIDQETYWLETTNRPDIGVDLNAPQTNEGVGIHSGYGLILEVKPGDTVFHYDLNQQALVGWSRAVGEAWEDTVYWASQAGSAALQKSPPLRLGWRRGLEGPFNLPHVLSRAEIGTHAPQIRTIRDRLLSTHGRPIYFPFEVSDKRPTRAAQAYLSKFPRDLVGLLALAPRRVGEPSAPYGLPYRHADPEIATADRDPFAIDPSVVDRGLRGHAVTQNDLARALEHRGLVPLRPRANDPQFDLAWVVGTRTYVAEVKSLTASNEERQLRLALGQVLRYAHQLGRRLGTRVRPVLAVEREPTDPSWIALCDSLDARLVWPARFDEMIEESIDG